MAIINDRLGNIYRPEYTSFKVWAPKKHSIKLLLYNNYLDVFREEYTMKKTPQGVHAIDIFGDLKGKYYTYLVDEKYEVTDPYAMATSVNGIKSAIIDIKDSHPEGWEGHAIPDRINPCRSLIYEMHIKDFTYDKSSNAIHRGKYLGAVEEGLSYKGYSTSLDHLKELGVSHVQLMPIFDFLTVDENKNAFFRDENYNWGYDPEHYNIPEGSYAIDPSSPIARIRELKSLILKFHQAGIRVIMDVVYNHSYRNIDSNLNILCPGYYYRMRKDGSFSNGSGCGNELASEKPMVRKFIIDSLKFWAKEYKMDGFRFDLMALLDIDTISEIKKELSKINKDILIYGEPWMAEDSTLPIDKRTVKTSQKGKGFALFNDDFRDGIKGDNNGYTRGFSQGNIHSIIPVEIGITGSINYNDRLIGFTQNPCETINYINSHDNLILQDKMKKVFPSESEEVLKQYNKFAFSILLTSQGIPLIHAGNEFLRSKAMSNNSYNLPASLNAIDWGLKEKHYGFFKYIKDLVYIKRSFEEFSIIDPQEIRDRLKFLYVKEQANLISYTIRSREKGSYLLIIHNGNFYDFMVNRDTIKEHLKENYLLALEKLSLKVLLNQNGLVSGRGLYLEDEITIPKISTLIVEIKGKDLSDMG